jgi:hypothetical protein
VQQTSGNANPANNAARNAKLMNNYVPHDASHLDVSIGLLNTVAAYVSTTSSRFTRMDTRTTSTFRTYTSHKYSLQKLPRRNV